MHTMNVRLNVALVAGSMPNFSPEGPAVYKRNAADLRTVAEEYGFDLTVYEEIIFTPEQAMSIRQDLDEEGFDLVIIFHPTYIIGDLVCELMKTDTALGLWAVEEISDHGSLPLCSLVCMNQNVTIASQHFGGRKIKWFFGSTDSRLFKRRFEITVRALTAVKTVRNARVAQIGQIAPGFLGMHYDDRALFRNLGVTIVHGIGIEDVVAAADAIDPDDVLEETVTLKDRFRTIQVGERKLEDSVRIFLAMKRICREHGLDAAAFSCWPRLQELKNMKPCVSNAMLDSINIPSACEGDMLSAVSMLILQTLTSEPAAVMDLPAFDIEDDSLLLWHCGSAPFDMADKAGVRCCYHYRAAFDDKTGDDQDGPVTDMVFAPGPVTVFRLTGEADRFYYFTGELFKTDKASWDGSRGWVRSLRMYGDPISSIDIMNTILTGGLQHHFPLVLKDVSEELEECAAWLGLNREPRIPYTDFLRTD